MMETGHRDAGRESVAGAGPDARSPTLSRLAVRFGGDVLETHAFRGDDTAVVRPERLVEVCRFLRDEAGLEYDMLVDLTAVDYPDRDPRFELVYHFLSLRHLHRVRIKVRAGGSEPCVDSLAGEWGCADWLEREVWDMFGVRFRGHPDLKRILMYDGFEGHPLRRDYPIDRRQPRIGPPD